MNHRVLGIDPGLSLLGWGVVETERSRLKHLGHGTLTTQSSDSLALRLLNLRVRLQDLIRTYKPDSLGIETLFYTKNISSAMPVAHARGVVLLTAAEASLAIGEYSPVTIKQSVVGQGGADKPQIQEMVRLLLGLAESPEDDHAADALAAAITHIHHEGPWSTASAAS